MKYRAVKVNFFDKITSNTIKVTNNYNIFLHWQISQDINFIESFVQPESNICMF